MLPLLYHSHHILDSEDLEFWIELAERQGGPILELGCGTGRVLARLASRMPQVFGLDRDYAMLEFLRDSTPAGELVKMHIIQADFSRFHLNLGFNLIVLPCNTYSTLSAPERTATLERVHSHMLPGGLFAASMPNPISLDSLPHQAEPEVEEVFPHPLDGEPVQVSSGWVRTADRLTITWQYDHLLPDGSAHRVQFDIVQQILPIGTILQEFESARLNIVEKYGEFDGSPYTDDSTYLILLASRV